MSDDCGDVVAELHDLSPGRSGSSLLTRGVVCTNDYVVDYVAGAGWVVWALGRSLRW